MRWKSFKATFFYNSHFKQQILIKNFIKIIKLHPNLLWPVIKKAKILSGIYLFTLKPLHILSIN